MRNVHHFYGAGSLRRQVLFDVTCDIWPGEIVIITGPSGSGKTTMLTLAGALRSVQEGSMKILGDELRGASVRTRVRIRENIGFIFQLHNLLECLTARQNVQLALGKQSLPRAEIQARTDAILQAVGLGDHLDYAPRELSGGQRQRVAVARALVRRPKIVLADEPTAALDRQTGRDVVELLRQLARREGCAVLLVTHDNRILDIADRIMLLEDGHLGWFGAAVSPHAIHLLTALSHMPERDHLHTLLARVNESEFLEMLKTMAAESEQLLNVLDLGNHNSIQLLFENILEAISAKIAGFLSADGAVLLPLRDGQIRALNNADRPSAARTELAAQVAEGGEAIQVSGSGLGVGIDNILCVPIRGRHEKVRAVAQVVNKRGGASFTPADERAFRDLAGPLGLIVEAYQRVAQLD
ncbi:MAG TPA: ATP-binding cassette domain-containing protein [Bryobacteraceae bacterium]|nr:ATP-binding cassette domain-containing protein [Bryobacteraceae bacterium]